METKFKFAALTLTLVALPVLSQAALTEIFTDRDAFLSLPSSATYLEDFNLLDLEPGNNLPFEKGELAYTASCEYGFYNAGEDTPGDVWLSLNNRTDSITFTFTSENIYRVGGSFFATDVDGNERPGTVFVSINDGSTYTATNTDSSTFVGFASDVPITSLTVKVDTSITNRWPSVNDLVVAIPEPSSFSMIALGFATGGVLLLRRLRG